MALTKYKVGNLITEVDERNNLGIREFYGININKAFMPTAANTEGLDETKYKVVRQNRFVFSGMQTGRDECIRISMYTKNKPILVSPAYTTFEVTATDVIIPMYFFLCFLSNEKDRLGAFLSDGSIRSNLDWPVFCDIELELPSLEIQQKYVDVYNSMLANQQNYERGLEDLKLVCDAYIENLRRKLPCKKIGKYINEIDNRNQDNKVNLLQGFCMSGDFIEPRRVSIDTASLKILKKGQLVYNRAVECVSNRFIIAQRLDETCAVSNSYIVFTSIDETVLSNKYLLLWLRREEFARYSKFISHGTAHENFEYYDMENVSIPIPDVNTQKSITDIYDVLFTRKKINEILKEQIKDICPILIKGAIEEGRKIKEA